MTKKGELRKPTPIKNFRAVHRETETQLVKICENSDGKEELLLEKTEDTHDLKSELKEVREELQEKMVEIKQVKQKLEKEFYKLQKFMDILKEMQKNMDEKMETLLNMQKNSNLTQADQAIDKEKAVPGTNYEAHPAGDWLTHCGGDLGLPAALPLLQPQRNQGRSPDDLQPPHLPAAAVHPLPTSRAAHRGLVAILTFTVFLPGSKPFIGGTK
uniref:Testis expressed 35 n=1 Tax=Ornithorhynchus anatinus TaxID=9258 RepID=A0A6I8N3C2_ORNAN